VLRYAIALLPAMVWGFFEMAGAPHVPLYWVFPFFTAATLVAIVTVRQRYK